MTKAIHIKFFSDAGHGWAKVSKQFLARLGIENKITSYSYERGDYAYLEEDCDVSTLVKAAEAHDYKIMWDEQPQSNYSRIRSYQPYHTLDGSVYQYQW
jgi:hypothetical protein